MLVSLRVPWHNDGEYDCLAASDSKWECSKCSSADLPVLNSVDAVDVFHFDFQKTYVDLYGVGCERSITTLVVHGSLGHNDFEWKSTNSCVTD